MSRVCENAAFGVKMAVRVGWLLVGVVCCWASCAHAQMGQFNMQNMRDVNTNQGWMFLKSFRFNSNKAAFRYSISYDRTYAPMNFLFYREDQYLQANDPSKTCKQRWEYLRGPQGRRQYLELDTTRPESGCQTRYEGGREMVSCQGTFYADSQRPVQWYVVASRCGNQNGMSGMKFRYSMEKYFDQNGDFPYLSGQTRTAASLVSALLVPAFCVLLA